MNDSMNIEGLECYEKAGVAYLKLETVARGLGFTTVASSGHEVVRWNTVYNYLHNLNVVAGSCNGNYRENCPDFIPENIFYRLAMKAKNEAAERFQAKIADEVIPSIRKHGAYMTPETLDRMISSPEFGIRLLTALKDEQEKRKELEQENAAQRQRIGEMRPKEIFADAVSVSDDSILIGALAKIIKQNGVDMGQKRLFAWLRNNSFLMKAGSDYNMPTQRAMELGLFKIKERTINNPDGSVRITKTVLVTGKGQQYFVNKFLTKYLTT